MDHVHGEKEKHLNKQIHYTVISLILVYNLGLKLIYVSSQCPNKGRESLITLSRLRSWEGLRENELQ